MTHLLQVLDLVVNGPIKSHIRKFRAKTILEAFRDFKAMYDAELLKSSEERTQINFVPPKPTLLGTIQKVIGLFSEDFRKAEFRSSIAKSFIKTGSFPNIDEGNFKLYEEIKSETSIGLPIIPLNCQPPIPKREEKVEVDILEEGIHDYLDSIDEVDELDNVIEDEIINGDTILEEVNPDLVMRISAEEWTIHTEKTSGNKYRFNSSKTGESLLWIYSDDENSDEEDL